MNNNYTIINKEQVLEKILKLGPQVALDVNGLSVLSSSFLITKPENREEFESLLKLIDLDNISQITYNGERIDLVAKDCIYSLYKVDERYIKKGEELSHSWEQFFAYEMEKDYREEIKPKIICSNKLKTHMQVHKEDFLIDYESLLQFAHSYDYLDIKGKDLAVLVVEFPFNIGYSSMCQTDETHRIVYAKRNNRDIFSKFTLDGKKKLTNKCVIILKQDRSNKNEYFVITMFPGETPMKEPQDINIKTLEERQQVDEFWKNHALFFKPEDINLGTLVCTCPYDIGV